MVKIDNSQVIEYLCSVYSTAQKADKFIIGFPIDNKVFFAEIPLDIVLTEFSGVSMTSDETPCKRLRIKPLTKKTAILFNSFSPCFLCDFEELQTVSKTDFSGNNGQAFEKMVCAFYGGKQTADSLPFWQGGDFIANGIQYQAKFQLATIITEYTAKAALQSI